MPNNVKTYDGTGDPEDHVKFFQAAAQLPPESIDGYKDLKAAFLAYFMQQKKYVKDPVEIHNIKQRDGETIGEFMERFKVETRRMKGAPECMRISEFMHGVNNSELTKPLNEHVPKTMEEMMITTTTFIRGEAAAAGKKKGHTSCSTQDQSKRHGSERMSDFRGQPRDGRGSSNSGTEGPLVIKAEIGGHMIHRMSLSPYNGIIGRPGIREIQAVPSTAHRMLKFPVDGGIVTIRGSQSKTLSAKGRIELCSLLKKNLDILAWQPSDMTGVPRSIAEHRLNIREGYSPVRQKKRPAPERAKAIQAEIVTPFKCLLDATKVITRQIQMAETDEEKTAFHTSQGVYYYTKMPFGLKNAGATYQQLVDKAFDNQVGRNIKVYVDDLVIKSHTEVEMLRDIDETFRTLRKINMKLNPKKCTFGAVEGMFLGYMISPEAQLPSPRTIKEVQSLNGKLAKAEQTFKQLKQNLSELPLLVAPKPKEELIVYMSATHGAISAVLMTERGTVQTLVYFVSRALHGLELNYTPMEKLVLSLVFAAKRLRSPEGTEFTYALRFQFTASNNEAEYEALIAGLWIAAQMGVRNVHVSVDSKLVANQVLGAYIAKEENMIKYLEKVKCLVSGFANFSISQVPRSKNKKADALSKIASTSFAHLSKQVLVEILKEKSIQEKEVTTVVEEDGPTWMTPIIEYLNEGTLPDDRKEASKLCIKARQYELLEGILYKWSFLKSWLRCVGPLQADYVIREIHEGLCSMHAGPRSVVAKAMRLGYYWPTMHRDAREMIRTCNDFQIHRHMPRNPQQPLTTITAPWPFYKWGIDIAGPFPEGPGKVKFLIVAMDYFTKWIEAKAVATITGN
ncbi:reverse transcriptase domain-containing protein [Tanacetum coccineum]